MDVAATDSVVAAAVDHHVTALCQELLRRVQEQGVFEVKRSHCVQWFHANVVKSTDLWRRVFNRAVQARWITVIVREPKDASDQWLTLGPNAFKMFPPIGEMPPETSVAKVPPPSYVCRRCGISGHFIQDCPTADAKSAKAVISGPLPTPPPGYVCHRCHQTGHYIQYCPLKEAEDKKKALAKSAKARFGSANAASEVHCPYCSPAPCECDPTVREMAAAEQILLSLCPAKGSKSMKKTGAQVGSTFGLLYQKRPGYLASITYKSTLALALQRGLVEVQGQHVWRLSTEDGLVPRSYSMDSVPSQPSKPPTKHHSRQNSGDQPLRKDDKVMALWEDDEGNKTWEKATVVSVLKSTVAVIFEGYEKEGEELVSFDEVKLDPSLDITPPSRPESSQSTPRPTPSSNTPVVSVGQWEEKKAYPSSAPTSRRTTQLMDHSPFAQSAVESLRHHALARYLLPAQQSREERMHDTFLMHAEDAAVSKQYGLLGEEVLPHAYGRQDSSPLLFMNTSRPFSCLTFGADESCSSRTLATVLENCVVHQPPFSFAQPVVKSLVLHYDSMEAPLCSATSLTSPSRTDIGCASRLRVFVCPDNFRVQQRKYSDVPNCTVHPLLLKWKELSVADIHTLLRIPQSGDLPAGFATVQNHLKRIQMEDHLPPFESFKSTISQDTFSSTHASVIMQRLQLLGSFLVDSKENEGLRSHYVSITDMFKSEQELQPPILLLDLSNPLLHVDDVGSIFQVAMNAFVRTKTVANKLLVLDKAHHYLREDDADPLAQAVVQTVRQMRNLKVRVALGAESPLCVPLELLELVSCVVMHRFHSTNWFKTLQAALPLSDEFMDIIMGLYDSEAVVFASSWPRQSTPYVRSLRLRQRFTEDADASGPSLTSPLIAAKKGKSPQLATPSGGVSRSLTPILDLDRAVSGKSAGTMYFDSIAVGYGSPTTAAGVAGLRRASDDLVTRQTRTESVDPLDEDAALGKLAKQITRSDSEAHLYEELAKQALDKVNQQRIENGAEPLSVKITEDDASKTMASSSNVEPALDSASWLASTTRPGIGPWLRAPISSSNESQDKEPNTR